MKSLPRTLPTGGAENRIIKTASKQQAACLKRRRGRWIPDKRTTIKSTGKEMNKMRDRKKQRALKKLKCDREKKPWQNSEGYYDPTAYLAIRNASKRALQTS